MMRKIIIGIFIVAIAVILVGYYKVHIEIEQKPDSTTANIMQKDTVENNEEGAMPTSYDNVLAHRIDDRGTNKKESDEKEKISEDITGLEIRKSTLSAEEEKFAQELFSNFLDSLYVAHNVKANYSYIREITDSETGETFKLVRNGRIEFEIGKSDKPTPAYNSAVKLKIYDEQTGISFEKDNLYDNSAPNTYYSKDGKRIESVDKKTSNAFGSLPCKQLLLLSSIAHNVVDTSEEDRKFIDKEVFFPWRASSDGEASNLFGGKRHYLWLFSDHTAQLWLGKDEKHIDLVEFNRTNDPLKKIWYKSYATSQDKKVKFPDHMIIEAVENIGGKSVVSRADFILENPQIN